MAYSALTVEGQNFITYICTKGGTDLLSGKKKTVLPFSNQTAPQTWSCDIVDPKDTTKKITTGTQLANALIYWFNLYAKQYELDANIVAAQAYAESRYIMWTYADTSTASGVNQFVTLTTYGIVVKNDGTSEKMSISEIAKITANLIEPLDRNSYNEKSDNSANQKANRPLIHQNIINNPDVMIKAQCRYLKNIANASDSLASTTLFCYSRGQSFASKTYTNAIHKCYDNPKYGEKYAKEGLDYVLKIFGILGDKDNWLETKGLGKGYKPHGYYFGYDESKGTNDPKNLKLRDTWSSFNANVDESKEYGITGFNDKDSVLVSLSKESNYKFIYYPENDYNAQATKKVQIVLHHTVSGDNVAGDIRWWETQVSKKTGGNPKIAVSFIVGRRGEIFQLFSTEYWAYHLGISKDIIQDYGLAGNANETLNANSVGIEIDSWGGLVQSGGYWYPTSTDDANGPVEFRANTRVAPIPVTNVVQYNASNGYPEGFHGYYGFEKYTNEQIKAVKTIIYAVQSRFPDIKLGYANDIYPGANMWGKYNASTKQWSAEPLALQGKPGIWTHVSYRSDKSDCDPQPELITMLKSL